MVNIFYLQCTISNNIFFSLFETHKLTKLSDDIYTFRSIYFNGLLEMILFRNPIRRTDYYIRVHINANWLMGKALDEPFDLDDYDLFEYTFNSYMNMIDPLIPPLVVWDLAIGNRLRGFYDAG